MMTDHRLGPLWAQHDGHDVKPTRPILRPMLLEIMAGQPLNFPLLGLLDVLFRITDIVGMQRFDFDKNQFLPIQRDDVNFTDRTTVVALENPHACPTQRSGRQVLSSFPQRFLPSKHGTERNAPDAGEATGSPPNGQNVSTTVGMFAEVEDIVGSPNTARVSTRLASSWCRYPRVAMGESFRTAHRKDVGHGLGGKRLGGHVQFRRGS